MAWQGREPAGMLGQLGRHWGWAFAARSHREMPAAFRLRALTRP